MLRNYNVYTLLCKVTNHLFKDDGSYDREVNKPYLDALAHIQWRMQYLSNLLETHKCPRIAQVISDFEDLLLEVEDYYNDQCYVYMRKTLLEIEKQIFRDTLSEEIERVSRIEVVQGNDMSFDSNMLKLLFSVFQPTPAHEELHDIYTEFKKEYSDLNSEQKKALSEDEVYKVIKAAMYTTFDLKEDE